MDIHACGVRSTPFLLLIHVSLLHSEFYLKIFKFKNIFYGISGKFWTVFTFCRSAPLTNLRFFLTKILNFIVSLFKAGSGRSGNK